MSVIKGKCLGGMCSWVYAESEMTCYEGEGNCKEAAFLEAEESSFHDAALIEATATIKAALAKAQSAANGRQLSIIQTRMGVLLAWVGHDEVTAEETVTANDSDEVIIEALGIKIPASAY